MVQLAVKTSTELVGGKEPHHQAEPLLNDTVGVQMKSATVVHSNRGNGRYQRKHAVGFILGAFILVAIGGALAGLYFSGNFMQAGELDYQRPDHDYHGEHREGHAGGGRGQIGEHQHDTGGIAGGRGENDHGDGVDSHRKPGHHGDPKGETSSDVGKGHTGGHRGRFALKGIFDGHKGPKHHHPIP